ncbi:DUF1127 domain-containing protein [Rhizobium sp. RU36D]|uniref:DUF1127 domain-containing protein n=1 Tax=Rhizobium sp. RU36D TaxID=1907415 RepID=UPI0032AFE5E5
MDQYLNTIDTIYPDGYQREFLFRDNGDMVDAAPVDDRKRSLLSRVFRAMSAWNTKRSSRLALRDLNDSQLRDIGVSRSQAMIEARKAQFPFK